MTVLRARFAPIALFTMLLPAGTARPDYDPAAQFALGNPSGAVTDPLLPHNYLISRPQYALAYIRDYGAPRWVSWHLNGPDIGTQERGSFRQDPDLPPGWYRVKKDENPLWSKEKPVGFERGHICPSKDRTSDEEANDQVFLMTNIVPQTSDSNHGPWEKLEMYEQNLAKSGSECYIIAGIRGVAKKISQEHVAVPKYMWKIIVVLPDAEGDDVARISAQTRVIAVEVPNVTGIAKQDWRKYRLSAGTIEKRTGLRFFTRLPDVVRRALLKKKDTTPQ